MIATTATDVEMQNDFSRYLNIVMEGKEVIVTKNGKEVESFVPKDATISYLTDSLTGILKGDYDLNQAREEGLKERNFLLKIEETLCALTLIFEFVELNISDLIHAFKMKWNDFEDAVQSVTAERIHADYIITRNIRDLKKSSVMTLTPAEFIARL